MRTILLHSTALLLTLLSVTTAKAQYELFDYPGATNTWITGMNDLGDFVGYYTEAGITRGFYVIGTDTADLVYPDATSTWANSISNDRKVVGTYSDNGVPSDNEGFIWDYYNPNYEDLTYLITGNGTYTEVLGLNDNGCWAGHHRANSTAYMMYSCPNYGTARYNLKATYGTAINNNDDLAGYYIDGAEYTGYIWTGPELFYLINYPGQIKTRVWGMNDDYIVVGDFANQKGFIYDGFIQGGDSYEEIEIPGAVSVTPRDINNNDHICGFYSDAGGSIHGFFIRGYDIGFRPNPDAWSFSNNGNDLWTSDEYGAIFYFLDPYLRATHNVNRPFPPHAQEYDNERFPSWQLFVDAFGEEQTYENVNGVLHLRERAFNSWSVESGNWGGSCFGMSYTSLMNYDNNSWFQGQFPYVGPGPIYSHSANINTRRAINRTQTFPISDTYFQARLNNTADSPSTTLQRLKTMMVDTLDDHMAIYIKNMSSGSGSHSVVPFKIERGLATGWEDVFVYDSNYPNDTTRHIRVNKQAPNGGEWYYMGSVNAGNGQPEEWGGPGVNQGFYVDVPVSTLLQTPELHSELPQHDPDPTRAFDFVTAYFSTDAEEYFTYGSDTLGYYNGNVKWQTDNGVPHHTVNSSTSPPIGYFLDELMTHSATIVNAQDPSVYMDVFTDNSVIGFSRNDANAAQTDLVEYDNGLTYTNPDAANKMVHLKSFVSDAGTSYHFWIDSIASEQGAQLHIEPVNTNELIVTNTGNATTYDLKISILSSSDASRFEISDVPFAEDGIHHIVPYWNDLADEGIYITVDTLSTGVDDTLFLDNQALPLMGLSDGEMYYSNTAQSDTVFVINAGGGHLNWNVASMPSWLSVVQGATGTDDDRIIFDLEDNTGPDRNGWLVINSNDSNSPDSVLITQSFSTPVDVETLSEGERFIIYPNPAAQVLNIGFSGAMATAEVRLFDVHGRMVLSHTYGKQSGQLLRLDVSTLTSGMYLLEVKDQHEVHIRKVMIGQ